MSQPQTLQDWLGRIEKLHPRDVELGLERVRGVAERLQLDFSRSRQVIVAGTNGKGSTVAALQSILLRHGLSVASYTSPHLLEFNERIVIDGKPLDDAVLCAAFEAVERARGDTELTFFEFTTLAALYCFSRFQPHICLLEVGLGGRLDAVNIIDGDYTLVTNIQLDHQAWLGQDRETIAREKAGIFRAGVPALCAERAPPASLRQVADQRGATWLQLGDHFSLQQTAAGWHWHGRDADGSALQLSGKASLTLHPDAVAGAIQLACLLLQEPQMALMDIALDQSVLPGRCQFLSFARGHVVLDVAHNPAAMTRLVEALQDRKCKGKTHLVFAMLDDKPGGECASMLAGLVDGQWWLPQLEASRAKNPAQMAAEIPHDCKPASSVAEAMAQAMQTLDDEDRLVVTGSFYTVAAAMDYLAAHRQ